MQINQPAPDFELPDLRGNLHKLSEYRGRIVIINFWSCECPHSERADRLIAEWLAIWDRDIAYLPIASNRNESTQSVEDASETRGRLEVLMDAWRVVADLYEAVTTPHVFVLDQDGILRYRGAVDDATFRNRMPTRFFLKEAIDSLIEGHSPPLTETPAFGCAIVREI
jgi:peroxiredoxin